MYSVMNKNDLYAIEISPEIYSQCCCKKDHCINKAIIRYWWLKFDKRRYPAGVYTKFSGRLSEKPFPWLIQKFPCILIFKTGQHCRNLE